MKPYFDLNMIEKYMKLMEYDIEHSLLKKKEE